MTNSAPSPHPLPRRRLHARARGRSPIWDRALHRHALARHPARYLGLDKDQMSWIYSAFANRLRRGSKYRPLAGRTAAALDWCSRGIVSWWSAFTLLTAAAWNFNGDARRPFFLFGGGRRPARGRALDRTFLGDGSPRSERRPRFQGFFFAAAHLAGGPDADDRAAPDGTSSAGAGCSCSSESRASCGQVAWYRWFSAMSPKEHPSVNAAELASTSRRGRDGSAGHSRRLGHTGSGLFGHRNTAAALPHVFPEHVSASTSASPGCRII